MSQFNSDERNKEVDSFTIKDAKRIVKAWENLDEGHHDAETIGDWLLEDMKPVIDSFRKKIKKHGVES